MFRPKDNNEHNEEEEFEEAQEQQDRLQQDSDYYTFDNVRKMALESEHGDAIDRNDGLNEDGSYKLNLEGSSIPALRKMLYDYFALNKVLNSMEFSETFLHIKYLRKEGVLSNLRVRYNSSGRLLGIDFRLNVSKSYQKVIVRGKGSAEFEYSQDKNSCLAINIFKARHEEARNKYQETISGQIEDEIRSELSEEVRSELAEDDNQSIGSTVGFNKDSEKVSFQKSREKQELSDVIDEEVEKTKFELIEEVELDMQGNRDHITGVFGKLLRDNDIEPYGDTPYLDNIENVMKPISEMLFYKNPEYFTDNDLTADELYDQQMKFIEDNIKDIDKRIAVEEAKGDGANKQLIKAYKELRDYLDLKIDTLNVYFERPVKAEYFKRQIKRLVRRNRRLAFERGKKWVKAKLPEFLAGIVVSVGGIVFSIYELAENMGKGIVEKGHWNTVQTELMFFGTISLW